MKFIYLSVLLILLGSSCSKNKNIVEPEVDPEPKPEITEAFPLHLDMRAERVSIFKGVKFSLQDSLSPLENGANVMKYDFLDSLIWTIDGASKPLQLIQRRENSENYKGSWTHYFYEPGNFKAYLKGYLKGDLVVNDSTNIAVSLNNENDFLFVSWKDIKGDMKSGNIGYPVNGLEDYSYSVFHGVYDGVKSATLNLQFDDIYKLSLEERFARKKKIFSDYITKLYGSAKQFASDVEANTFYTENFKKPLDEASVIQIWQTEKANIALIGESKDLGDRGDCFIYAEPRN
ncbi:hypothetical protein ACFSQ3_13830 [Sphingobacterium corticis]|uniref:Lipoprotein n=1 Tax=Sphingobacterium corticis TaxID=1812823 RepID=A0ABW5NLR8_9SPHI